MLNQIGKEINLEGEFDFERKEKIESEPVNEVENDEKKNIISKTYINLFGMLMDDPNNRLELYNVLNNSNYKDPSAVDISYIGDFIKLSVRDDYSYIINGEININIPDNTKKYEIPHRCMKYFKIYLFILLDSMKKYGVYYKSSTIPQFVVLFNGDESMPSYSKISLLGKEELSKYDINTECNIINISSEDNDIVNNCPFYKDYIYLIEMIRMIHKEQHYTDIEGAIEKAINICIEKDILRDFLQDKKDEVLKILNDNFLRFEEVVKEAKEEYAELKEKVNLKKEECKIENKTKNYIKSNLLNGNFSLWEEIEYIDYLELLFKEVSID